MQHSQSLPPELDAELDDVFLTALRWLLNLLFFFICTFTLVFAIMAVSMVVTKTLARQCMVIAYRWQKSRQQKGAVQ